LLAKVQNNFILSNIYFNFGHIFFVHVHKITIKKQDMEKAKGKIRIKDIARMAGVSEGTVDRVLHQRGVVSEKSRKAVKKVLEEIDYTPNLLARSLASKKKYRFICLFPAYNKGEYWESIEKGFRQASEEFNNYKVEVMIEYFDQFDSSSFLATAKAVFVYNPDAIIMAPVFRQETILFARELTEKKIPFSFIDSMVENVEFTSYYGQHSLQSGYVAGKLLFNSLPKESKILVLHTYRKGGSGSIQTENRKKGFLQYIEENNLKNFCEILSIEIIEGNDEENMRLIRNAFIQHPDIRAAITFNSKVHRLVKYFKNLSHSDIKLIGYDVLEENVKCMKEGFVSFLIAQRPEKQAYCAVRDMSFHLIFDKEVNKINYVPIDILMKENIDYYLNFNE